MWTGSSGPTPSAVARPNNGTPQHQQLLNGGGGELTSEDSGTSLELYEVEIGHLSTVERR